MHGLVCSTPTRKHVVVPSISINYTVLMHHRSQSRNGFLSLSLRDDFVIVYVVLAGAADRARLKVLKLVGTTRDKA